MNTLSSLRKPACLYALLAASALVVASPGSAIADGTSPKDGQTRPVSPGDVPPSKATQGSSSFTPMPPGTKSGSAATGSGKEQKQK
jgi:hypothetical protein